MYSNIESGQKVLLKYFVLNVSCTYKQAENAGLPPPPEVTDSTDTKLRSRQFMIETGSAQENADSSKAAGDASHQMSEDHIAKLSDQLKGQLVRHSLMQVSCHI